MLLSRYLLRTAREAPAEAEVISHQLMMRAGMIRKLASGIHSFLPLGLRTVRKVEAIVREEMNAAGAQEVLLPVVQPGELWKESGRWDHYGKELLRFQDRHDRWFCLGPTHEEVITDLVRREVRSYRDLPQNLYQIQTKFRDEVRPRFGVMRSREFIMKDGYSFDATEEAAEVTYKKMYDAYMRIFTRCGLTFTAVEAATGNIGGKFSHEFMVLAETGEDALASCSSCGYGANMEKAEVRRATGKAPGGDGSRLLERVRTPGARTVEDVAAVLNVAPRDIVKTIIVKADADFIAVLVRGDHELNLAKLGTAMAAESVELAGAEDIVRITRAPVGFAGPVGLTIPVMADYAVARMASLIVGANESDHHLTHVAVGRDMAVKSFGDFRTVQEGDGCPRCDGVLKFTRGIEVGHIFKLGTKYSEAMHAAYLDSDGKERLMIMGCYGIGITRTVAAAIEQGHDENGIIFPPALAPFHAILLPLDIHDEQILRVAMSLYAELEAAGVDILLDDRDERPGVKFKDADLLGIPLKITVGQKGLKEGKVEIKKRTGGEADRVEIAAVTPSIRRMLSMA